jgi:filamentous hemagglutinin family protein
MNCSYRFIWNKETQRYVPAPEVAKGRGKGSGRAARAVVVVLGLAGMVGGAAALGPIAATALPTGGQVVVGQATLTTSISSVAAAANLIVNQSSVRAVINWDTFNVGSAAKVIYVQPSPSSVVLNRVVGAEPSQIFGQIQANGQVYLVNPNGVLFAPGAQVNVHGLLATTKNTLDADFMAGKPVWSGQGGEVRNEGVITTDAGGVVSLIGGVVANTGVITVQGADALVGQLVNSADMLQAQGLTVSNGVIELLGDVVHQAGTLNASSTNAGMGAGMSAGTVVLSGRSVLQDGLIQANALQGTGGQVSITATETLLQTQQAQVQANGVIQGGHIVLAGGQAAYLSGRSQASGIQGGQISASAAMLTLAGASLSADGSAQGGRVRIGGDVHGAALQGMANAQATVVDASSQLSAQGAGGQVVVWSDGNTTFEGSASTGPAGFIEISGQGTRTTEGGDTNHGQGGQTLLDPTNLVIGNAVQAAVLAPAGTTLMLNVPLIADAHDSGAAVVLLATDERGMTESHQEMGDSQMIKGSPSATGIDSIIIGPKAGKAYAVKTVFAKVTTTPTWQGTRFVHSVPPLLSVPISHPDWDVWATDEENEKYVTGAVYANAVYASEVGDPLIESYDAVPWSDNSSPSKMGQTKAVSSYKEILAFVNIIAVLVLIILV